MHLVIGMLLIGIGSMLLWVAFYGSGVSGFSGVYGKIVNAI